MLDVSDGLLGDLGHILDASRCGASLEEKLLPIAPVLAASSGDIYAARTALLSGGDDYELLFTAPITQREKVQALSEALQTPLTRIGSMTHKAGNIWWVMADGSCKQDIARGFDHFG